MHAMLDGAAMHAMLDGAAMHAMLDMRCWMDGDALRMRCARVLGSDVFSAMSVRVFCTEGLMQQRLLA
jgi:hypothetical protein